LKLIEDTYTKDFELGGYEMISAWREKESTAPVVTTVWDKKTFLDAPPIYVFQYEPSRGSEGWFE
jgi:hypothetical protein